VAFYFDLPFILKWLVHDNSITLPGKDPHSDDYEDYKNVIANGLPISEGKSEVWIHPLITGD
jgi:hypothetical protein